LNQEVRVIPVQIEKEMLIEAPVDVVWRIVTEPDQITRWFSDEAHLDLRAGGQGRLVWTGRASYPIQIEAVDAPRRFAFRWLYPDGSRAEPGNSTLVEFTLSQEGGNTRLRVVESGFDQIDWSDEEKVRRVQQNTRGWEECFAKLQEVAQRQPRARRG
jgi:uncharacterized protein YndB with AHSA1/START domain